jgi:hypothetical protein
MDLDTRFPTKLQTVSDAPESFRAPLVNNIPSGESIRLLVYAPAFSTAGTSSPATVLAVTASGWLAASENDGGGVSVEKANFNETLFVELAYILISGQLTIHFASVGSSYSATMKFDTVGADYYQEAIELILNGIDQNFSTGRADDREAALVSEAWPPQFRADVNRYRPKGQPLLDAIRWPAVLAGFQREFCPPGALLVTKRELVLISAEKASPLHFIGLLDKSGRVITYFPIVRIADFHVGHHGRFGVLALQVHASHGGEKLEIIFPSDSEQTVSKVMERALLSANSYV